MILVKRIIFLALLVYISSCSSAKKTQVSSRPQPKPAPEVEKTTPASSTTSPDINKVIEAARSFIGTPYKYGGTTRAGMDCSGLMLMSFKAAGLNLPRTADAQSNFGKNRVLNL